MFSLNFMKHVIIFHIEYKYMYMQISHICKQMHKFVNVHICNFYIYISNGSSIKKIILTSLKTKTSEADSEEDSVSCNLFEN